MDSRKIKTCLTLFLNIMVLFICKESMNNEKINLELINPMPALTIEQVQKNHEKEIMSIPGVVGIGIGAIQKEKVIKIFVISNSALKGRKLPEKLEGYKVVIEETGVIRPM